jgi:acetoacetyl-CoA synthetase
VELAGLGLASGATLLLYDGSPLLPGAAGRAGEILFDYADAEGMTHFGTSAKFIDAIAKSGLKPRATHRLDRLRAMFSTGSPLARKASTMSIATSSPTSCWRRFPAAPTFFRASRSAIRSCRSTAANCNVVAWAWRSMFSTTRAGRLPAGQGERGELVCTAPFPAMPIGFWNDPDGSRYHAAYFARFPNVWCHGDFVELTAQRRA